MSELINSVKPTCRGCGSSSDARSKHILYSQETGGRAPTVHPPGINTPGEGLSARQGLLSGITSQGRQFETSQANHPRMFAVAPSNPPFPRGEINTGKLKHGDCRESPNTGGNYEADI